MHSSEDTVAGASIVTRTRYRYTHNTHNETLIISLHRQSQATQTDSLITADTQAAANSRIAAQRVLITVIIRHQFKRRTRTPLKFVPAHSFNPASITLLNQLYADWHGVPGPRGN